ncbi:type VI secretion system-associated protein VasI [Dyella sp. C11]|uniref:type VI secretion system-associated protein VasI n=1 Tax=Dyella sp. C11 TaxID=2126991 RepID=UPI000D653041|nr:type VI secretion system-associated protein VasI [Dyella sp. C11]
MKLRISSLLLLSAAACSHGNDDPARIAATQTPDCTKITSSVQRLACFDSVAGTPVTLPAMTASSTLHASAEQATVATVPLIVQLVQRNENQRKPEDHRFLLSRSRDDGNGAMQIVISAPAINGTALGPVMAISCLSGITRLQLLAGHPIANNRLRMQLLLDGKAVADAAAWQVLEVGSIADAGRGLVAIDTLKQLGAGAQLQTKSDFPTLDGLVFDASDLHELIKQQREACHW